MEKVLTSHQATEKLKGANLHKLTTEPQFYHGSSNISARKGQISSKHSIHLGDAMGYVGVSSKDSGIGGGT